MKHLVNLYSLDKMHLEDQCLFIKRLFYKYKAQRVVIDANGVGLGLVEYLVKPSTDSITGEVFPDFGVMNDKDGDYKQYRTQNCEFDALYLIKANAPINTEAHANVQAQLDSGKLKFLIDEQTAKTKLLGTVRGQNMTPEERKEYLIPFTLTNILKEEMMNLKQENEGVNIILKQANRSIKKDKFSSLEYALYYLKQEEDGKKRKRAHRIADMMFMT